MSSVCDTHGAAVVRMYGGKLEPVALVAWHLCLPTAAVKYGTALDHLVLKIACAYYGSELRVGVGGIASVPSQRRIAAELDDHIEHALELRRDGRGAPVLCGGCHELGRALQPSHNTPPTLNWAHRRNFTPEQVRDC